MCGIAGMLDLDYEPIFDLDHKLNVMNVLQRHRGPDAQHTWLNSESLIGFAHQRLSIIDLNTGHQPMSNEYGLTICYNGEIYNFKELKRELSDYSYKTNSDTEVILAAYLKYGQDCVNHFRGMFAFAIWDERQRQLFIARDRFGIKPLYYTIENNIFYFASEIKTLLPFTNNIEVNANAFKEYLFFQLYLGTGTLFKNIFELKPAHLLTISDSNITVRKYWEVYYNLDWEHDAEYFSSHLKHLIEDSVKAHTLSDVPIGAYVSGGIDSGIISSLATQHTNDFLGFSGKFEYGDLYDESHYARLIAHNKNFKLHEIAITANDFQNSIEKIIYHLDQPVAGPGSFPQFHVSKLASQYRKVVLGGQGGDEIFGGYTRYLIAYFEQCIKGAIDNTLHNGNFVVTYESIIPNMISMQNYKPLLKEFLKEGMFDSLDKRYFRLVNRAPDLNEEINWNILGNYNPYETFASIFNSGNVGKESYFDKMTHFDFKTLLPALLHVEDRMSMAHGVESRVPFLDHSIVEFAATIPADKKFKNGELKMMLINTMRHTLPNEISNRKNKMGFPVPLNIWINGELKDFIHDIFDYGKNRNSEYFNYNSIFSSLKTESAFNRKTWGLLSLELWFKQFVDQHYKFKELINKKSNIMKVLITGGAGFIGSHISDNLLASGHKVCIIDNFQTGRRDNNKPNENLKLYEGTIADKSFVDKVFNEFKPEKVVHAAAAYKNPDDWEEDVASNILGTINIVRSAKQHNISRFIYFQTSLCYGLKPIEQPITLDHPLFSGKSQGGSSYAISKTAAEQYIELSGLDFQSFRLANAYGPRNLSGPLPTFFHRLTQGKPCFVMDTHRDFIFVDDLVNVVLSALNGLGTRGYYHIATGSDYSIKELFDSTLKALDIKLEKEIEVRKRGEDDVYTILIDPAKTEKDFGWKAKTKLEDGIKRAIDYYKEFGITQTFTHLKNIEEKH